MDLELHEVFKVVSFANLDDKFNNECLTDGEVDVNKVIAFFDKHKLPKTIKEFHKNLMKSYKLLFDSKNELKKGETYVFSSERIMGAVDFTRNGKEFLIVVEVLEDTYLDIDMSYTTTPMGTLEEALQPFVENHQIKITKVSGAITFESELFLITEQE